MQKLNPHTLFAIFEQGDEEIYRENNLEELLQNPYVLIGMVLTGVENFHLIDKIYTLRFPEQYEIVRQGVKLRYFDKLYNYLLRVGYEEFSSSYTIGNDFEVDRALTALLDLLVFFEQLEHYEKCATIKRFVDLLLNKKFEDAV